MNVTEINDIKYPYGTYWKCKKLHIYRNSKEVFLSSIHWQLFTIATLIDHLAVIEVNKLDIIKLKRNHSLPIFFSKFLLNFSDSFIYLSHLID